MRWWHVLGVGAVVWGCQPGGPHELRVDMRTDLVPMFEFDGIHVVIDEGEPQTIPVDDAQNYVTGTRLLLTELSRGDHVIDVELLRGEDVSIRRRLAVGLRSDFGVTAVLTRDCRGVSCPGDAGPTATECLGGRCVEAGCTPQTQELCEPGTAQECISADSCPGASATCGTVRCIDGFCLYPSDGALCRTNAFCDPDAGCRDPASVDGSWRLTATDGAIFFAYGLGGSGRVGPETRESLGGSDIFLEARSGDGSTIAWTRTYATDASEWVDFLETSPTGDLLMSGVAKAPALFADDGIMLDEVSGHDSFVAMLDPADGSVRWATPVIGDDEAADIVGVGANETGAVAFVVETKAGHVGSLTLPSGSFLPSLVRLDETGAPLWQQPLDSDLEVHTVAHRGDSMYVIGCTHGVLDVGGFNQPDDGKDAVVIRVDDVGGSPNVSWMQRLDSIGGDAAAVDAVFDDAGILHIIGWVSGETATFGGIELPPHGSFDAFVMGMRDDGTATYAHRFGTASVDLANAIDFRDGAIYVGGQTKSGASLGGVDFEGTSDNRNAFVLRLDTAGVPAWWRVLGSPDALESRSAAASLTHACAIGLARPATEEPFFRGLGDTTFFDCVPVL